MQNNQHSSRSQGRELKMKKRKNGRRCQLRRTNISKSCHVSVEYLSKKQGHSSDTARRDVRHILSAFIDVQKSIFAPQTCQKYTYFDTGHTCIIVQSTIKLILNLNGDIIMSKVCLMKDEI